MGISIHLSKSEDSPGIVELQKYTWICTYPNPKLGISTADIEEKVTGFKSDYWEKVNEQPDRHCWVAKDGTKIVGFCVASKDEEVNHLRALYVHPDFQRHGIGKSLISEALKWLGEEKDIHTEVVTYNTRAINFYKKHGFEEAGLIQSGTPDFLPGVHLPEIKMIRKKMTPSVGVIAFRNNNTETVLVMETERAEHMTGTYGVPSGRFEKGESSLEAAKREFEEETGLSTSEKDLLAFPGNIYWAEIKRKRLGMRRFSIEMFICKKSSGDLKESPQTVPVWVKISEMEKLNLLPNVKKAVDDALQYLNEVSG